MNVILFMSNAVHLAGTAVPQAERENQGSPWSGIFSRRIFVSTSESLLLLHTVFFVNTQKRQAPFLTMMTATKQAQAQDHRFQAQSLPSWTEMSVHSKEGPDPGKPEPQRVAPRSLRTISM